MADSFTCPLCGRTSHNPGDVAAGYCGACHIGGLPPAALADAMDRAGVEWRSPGLVLAAAMARALGTFAETLGAHLAEVARVLAETPQPQISGELRAALDAAGLGEHGVRGDVGDPSGDPPLGGPRSRKSAADG